ncbi:hypothetical protein RhiirA5_350775, partial [Rhizophagus irregularis]
MSGGFFNNVNQQINVNAAASSSNDWRLLLPDEERKANVGMLFKLFELMKNTFTTNQRFIASKRWEDEAYNKANSKEEYQQSISTKMQHV